MARPKAKAKSRKKSNVISVDFEGVESGGGATPDGYYDGVLKDITQEESADSGEPYLKFKWKTHINSVVYDNMSLQPSALFNLRNALEAMGMEVPEGDMDIDLDDLLESTCQLTVVNEEYEGKPQPRITGYMLDGTVEVGAAGETEKDEEEEPPKKSRKKPKAKVKEEEPEEPDEVTTADILAWAKENDLGNSDCMEVIKPHGYRKLSAIEDEDAAAILIELQEAFDGEEPEKDEEPTKPTKRTKGGAKSSKNLRPGAKVTFTDEEGEVIKGVLESVNEGEATVIDSDDQEWSLPLVELSKA